MSKTRIAFCGVFDLANYGDHLFPIVFESEMRKRKLDIEIILFSPIEGQQAFDDSVHVYALKDLEKMHIENPFDDIVIAGGEIIHLFKFLQKTKIGAEEFEKYPISETWLIPSFIAYKYNIKLIWNAPGIPFEFEDTLKNVVKAIVDNADYLSIRNDFSKKCLINCNIDEDKIKVVPDTAFAISETISLDELNRAREHVLSFNDKYVVFHSNKQISNDQINVVVNCLDKLKEDGYKIVLLPLAYTHGDDLILKEINERANYQYYVFDKYLSVIEMMSVLAKSSLYIGVSFHGAITAMQYGSKVIAFDFMKNDKTRDLFEYYDISNSYITDEADLEGAVQSILGGNQNIDLTKARSELKEHFDVIYKLISNQNKNTILRTNLSFAHQMTHGIVDSNIRINELKTGLEWHRRQDAERQIYIEGLEKYIKTQENGLEWHRRQDAERQTYIEGLEKQIDTQKNGLEWHGKQDAEKQKYIEGLEKQVETQKNGLEWYKNHDKERQTYINGLHEYINSLEKQISIDKDKQNELQATIYTMENSLSWKITKILRRNSGGKKI